MRFIAVFVGLSFFTACQNTSQDRPLASAPPATTAAPEPEPTSTPEPTPTAVPEPTPTAATPPAPPPTPMPPLAELKSLDFRLHQGGPVQPKCKGIISELTLDLVTKKWKRSLCGDKDKLEKKSGTLTAEHVARIETGWLELSRRPGPSCAADAQRLDLVVTPIKGAKQSFVNSTTSCGDKPPEVSEGLDDFYSQAFSLTQ